MAMGRCKLTFQTGAFVDSHIIPKAFTRPIGGQSFIQGGQGQRIFRNPSSWYDGALVIRKGEDVLSDIDNKAIKLLRKNKMVWSGWGQAVSLSFNEAELLEGYGLRRLDNIDSLYVRRFILSILWRAATSSRPEFDNVVLPSDVLEELRLMLLGRGEVAFSRLQVHLTQLSTIGPRHNLGPLLGSDISDGDDTPPAIMNKAYRFYFDGLIAYVSFGLTQQEYEESRNMFVGENEYLLLACIPFERSWQYQNLIQHIKESKDGWPEHFSRLVRS